jgi:hypothetical protein
LLRELGELFGIALQFRQCALLGDFPELLFGLLDDGFDAVELALILVAELFFAGPRCGRRRV